MTIADDLIRDEGLRLRPYRDTVGKLTLGVGRNLDDVGISEEEARHLLANDIARVEKELDRECAWWRRLSEPRQRALQNLVFNIGMGGLLKFDRMLAAMKAGDWSGAAHECLDSKWATQVGQRALRISKLIEDGE